MNLLLIVIDSLRQASLDKAAPRRPHVPFLDRLGRETVSFRRAHATECWTLPTHLSIFTGLLPSEHGAHFQAMGYAGRAPALAEILARSGFHTELITRNSIFDGTLPGVTRGFEVTRRPLAPLPRGLSPFLLVLALAKPRVRRLIRSSAFFHRRQKESVEFLVTLARMGLPADRLALETALERMADLRRAARPYFLFLNLYDVHAPYCPSEGSPLRPVSSLSGLWEDLRLPWVLPKVTSHAYLRPGFHLSAASRAMLLGRYHRAIELMDRKLEWFFGEAERLGLLEGTLAVVTSDHGEAFGEHGLYLHDASVYETHLHVPLWVRHPERSPEVIDDVVTTRHLFGLLKRVALGEGTAGTILDPAFREKVPFALAEHFAYPHAGPVLERFRSNQAAVITREAKVIRRGPSLEIHDLGRDPAEAHPEPATPEQAIALWRREGLDAEAAARASAHVFNLNSAGPKSSALEKAA